MGSLGANRSAATSASGASITQQPAVDYARELGYAVGWDDRKKSMVVSTVNGREFESNIGVSSYPKWTDTTSTRNYEEKVEVNNTIESYYPKLDANGVNTSKLNVAINELVNKGYDKIRIYRKRVERVNRPWVGYNNYGDYVILAGHRKK